MDQGVSQSVTDNGGNPSLSTAEAASRIEAFLAGELEQEDATQEEPEQSEPVEAEVEDTEESPEPAEQSEADEEPDEGDPIRTFDDLAKALEKSTEELESTLTAKVKINGKWEEVTLAEMRAGYQKDAAFRQNQQQLAEEKKAWHAEAQQRTQAIEAQLMNATHVLNAVESLVIKPLDQAEMQHLRATNPAEWAARIQEHNAQVAYVGQLKNAAQQSIAQRQQQLTEEQMQQRAQLLEREREALERIPGWGNELKAEIESYLTGQYGYTNDDLTHVVDHRLVDIVRKANLYDKMQAQGDLAKKKVANVPKLVKPGKPQGKGGLERSALEQAKARLRKTGSRRDAAEYIAQRFL